MESCSLYFKLSTCQVWQILDIGKTFVLNLKDCDNLEKSLSGRACLPAAHNGPCRVSRPESGHVCVETSRWLGHHLPPHVGVVSRPPATSAPRIAHAAMASTCGRPYPCALFPHCRDPRKKQRPFRHRYLAPLYSPRHSSLPPLRLLPTAPATAVVIVYKHRSSTIMLCRRPQ
jgi:hypothetical protein